MNFDFWRGVVEVDFGVAGGFVGFVFVIVVVFDVFEGEGFVFCYYRLRLNVFYVEGTVRGGYLILFYRVFWR